MTENENFATFLKENKKLVKEYLETRLDIYRLMLIRSFSRSAGYFIWLLISMLLLFLVFIFLGLVTAFWLSELTGSFIKGFALATLIIVVIIFFLGMLRKVLFVNPIIRGIISRSNEETETESNKQPV